MSDWIVDHTVLGGSTSKSINVEMLAADGTAKAGLAYTDITASYRRPGSGSTAITLATLASLTASYSSGGWVEDGNGCYRFDVPDAAIAAITGGGPVLFKFAATGALPTNFELIVTSKNTSTLNDAPALTDYQQRATAVTLPANPPTDWLNAAAVKADAVTKIQAGLSTYAGGDTPGTGTLLTRVTGLVALASGVNVIQWGGASVTGMPLPTGSYTVPPTAATIAAAVESHIIDDTDGEAVLTAITNKIASVNPSLGDLSVGAIAAAVWQNATRSLTDKASFTLTSDYDAAKTAASAANVLAVISHGDGAWLTATGFATPANVTAAQTAILTAMPAAFSTLTITAGGVNVHTLPNPAPDGYGGTFSGDISGLTDDQAAQLAAIFAKTNLLGAGVIQVIAPITTGGEITLWQGSDYRAADSAAIAITLAAGADLTGATVTLVLRGVAFACTVLAVAGGRSLQLELTAAQTAALSPGETIYEIHATLPSGHVLPVQARAKATILAPLKIAT